ncbi:MAG TPA: HD domain-containing protein [Candidatus Sulfotelmatobacter sp.]|nr:HD domain-containing protein [Candidatus Sulfotelmatobacter sp.]
MDYFEKISTNPLFLKLKEIEENNEYHDHEKTYDHLIKTFEIAKKQITADFIKNETAKKLFLEFVNTPFENLNNGEIMLLTALLHDIGKILYYKDGENEFTLRHKNSDGIVSNPGHEYWGSKFVKEFVKDTELSEKVIEKISKIIRLHDTFGAHYFEPKLNLSIEEIMDDVKARAEGLYIEELFNVYCDCFTAKPFEKSKNKVIEIFNQPSLYVKREYFIK